MTRQGDPLSLPAEQIPSAQQDDIAALAKGGRMNVFGFLLRLAARLPFLFIADDGRADEQAKDREVKAARPPLDPIGGSERQVAPGQPP